MEPLEGPVSSEVVSKKKDWNQEVLVPLPKASNCCIITQVEDWGLLFRQNEQEPLDLGNQGTPEDKEVVPFGGIKWKSAHRRENLQPSPTISLPE